jgi:phospholipid-binding lipoprotein MlaA
MMKNYNSSFLLLVFLIGCQKSSNPADPYEEYNRQVFAFNEKADQYFVNPILDGYKNFVPTPLRLAVSNFYHNITGVSYIINGLLQAEWQDSYINTLRFAVNSTFGVGGIFDMAHNLGLERKRHDFGQTLYFYGYKDSPYYVTPFFGPTTVRDSYALYVDQLLFNPLTFVNPFWIKASFLSLDILDTRASAADYLANFPEPPYAADRYVFVRDAFLQYRTFQLTKQKVDWDSFYDQ